MGDSITAASDWVGSAATEAGNWFSGGADPALAGGGFDVFEAGNTADWGGAGGFAGLEPGNALGWIGDAGSAVADLGGAAAGFDPFMASWDPGSTAQAVAGGADQAFGGLDQASGGTFMGTGGAATDVLSGGWSAQDPAVLPGNFTQGGGMSFGSPAGGASAASSVPSFGGSAPGAGPWINPDTGMPGVEPPGMLERAGSWAGDFAKSNPGFLLGGGLLAAQALMGNDKPPPAQRQVQQGAQDLSQRGQQIAEPAQQRLTETQGTLGQQGAANSAALETGKLPMGQQAAIDQATNAAIAKIRSQFASMGLSGSSMEAQMIAQARIAAQQQAFNEAMKLADLGFRQTVAGANINSGLSTTGTNMQTGSLNYFQNLAQQELADDQALSDAIARFATALPGAVVLPGQQGRTRQAVP